jgi:hypothetical protein
MEDIMTEYLELAKNNLKRAKEIIEELNIVEVWKSVNDIRKNILKIKWDAETIGMKAIGIEVYKAVIEDKVKTIDEFIKWKENQQQEIFNMWEPSC